MHPFQSVRNKFRLIASAIGLLALGLAVAGQADASCSIPTVGAYKGVSQSVTSASPRLMAAVYTPGQGLSAGFKQVGFDDDGWEWGPHAAAIVGLWKFSFVSKGSKGIPDGALIDAGYVTWHSDGTELMNSGRPPMTGSFCMGVWKPLGHDTFKLNHIALSWDPTGTVFVGPTNIREIVSVNRNGDSYTGTFTLDQYATDEKTVLAHVQGTVAATRVTAD
jgi:hypothetical protein